MYLHQYILLSDTQYFLPAESVTRLRMRVMTTGAGHAAVRNGTWPRKVLIPDVTHFIMTQGKRANGIQFGFYQS